MGDTWRKKVDKWIDAHGSSKKWLAEEVGANYTSFNANWDSETFWDNVPKVIHIARIMGLTVEQLWDESLTWPLPDQLQLRRISGADIDMLLDAILRAEQYRPE